MVTVRASLASRLSVQYFPLMDWPKHFHIPCSKASQGSCITLRTLWKNFKLKKKKKKAWGGEMVRAGLRGLCVSLFIANGVLKWSRKQGQPEVIQSWILTLLFQSEGKNNYSPTTAEWRMLQPEMHSCSPALPLPITYELLRASSCRLFTVFTVHPANKFAACLINRSVGADFHGLYQVCLSAQKKTGSSR